MRSTRIVALLSLLLIPVATQGRPRDPTEFLKFEAFQPPTQRLGAPVFRSANQGTVYFGGTTWAPDSARWEAIRDSVWTFDSGVGSHFDHDAPGVYPYKDPSLHAVMEGWTGFDVSFSEITYFRRSTDCPVATGFGMHCGVSLAESKQLCYAAGAGYGNGWKVCIGHPFDAGGGSATMDFDYANESEEGFDFSRVIVDTVGDGDAAHDVIAVEYTGVVAGHETLSLTPGETLPAGPRSGILVKFCFDSDGAWSDEDGSNPTTCGAFTVDNVALSGGITYPLQDFETGDGGWVLQPARPGLGGDWSNIVHLNDLPPYDPFFVCSCNLRDSVLVFEDFSAGGHGRYQDNLAASPWIDLKAAGLTGSPGKFIEFNYYAYLPLLNYVFPQFNIQWYPDVCLVDPQHPFVITSPWTSTGFGYLFGYPPPYCTTSGTGPVRINFYWQGPMAEQIRIAVGCISYCRFFANCTNIANSSPWFDDIRFGVFGESTAPLIGTRTLDTPQDIFPTDGTLGLHSTGRIDCNNVQGAASPEAGTSLGDTLVVQGAEDAVLHAPDGTQGSGAEVWVQFAVRPGPGTDPVALASWLVKFGPSADTRRGQQWYAAQMDTAERAASGAIAGNWMTTWIEGNPNFSGDDTDLDPNDPDPHGRLTRLENDMFPDDLLTAGSRLNLFYKSRYRGGTEWYTVPDTTGGNYLEMEVLPSSMDAEGHFNCVLYVDHFDGRGAQPFIEQALREVLPGLSANWEGTAWDRFNVRAPSSQQASFGRPLNTEYGANVVQALGYKTILWNSGNLDAFNLTKEDGDVLIPWFTLSGFGGRNIYLSGDGLAKSMVNEASSEPSAYRLLTEILGVDFACGTFRDQDCPAGSPVDETPCILLDPVAGALVSTRPLGGTQLGEGNGCPELRSFDVLRPSQTVSDAVPQAEESYVGEKTGEYASVSSVRYERRPGLHARSRAVVDGISVHYRRDPGDCAAHPGAPPQAVQERLQEVLDWFAVGDADICMDVTAGVDVEAGPPPALSYTTRLLPASPNPLRGGAGAHIRFSLARNQRVALGVYDLRGARVRVLLDGPGARGWNEVVWDGADASGRRVADGIYFYRLTAGETTLSKKLVVLAR